MISVLQDVTESRRTDGRRGLLARARVFDMFVQEGQALDRAQGGLGLGLAIVKSLVTLHGGEVRAISDGVGKGSEFRVTLPALAPETPTHDRRKTTARVPVAGTAPRPKRILVVDDNVDATELLGEVRSMLGHDVLVAHDGPTARTLAAEGAPTLALLDIGLPVMDGYELARGLRALPGLERISLAAVTGYSQASDRARSRGAGFDAHLMKPIDLDQVRSLVTRLTADESSAIG